MQLLPLAPLERFQTILFRLYQLHHWVYGTVTNEPAQIHYDDTLGEAIETVEPYIRERAGTKINSRWASLRLIDGDHTLLQSIDEYLGFDLTGDQVLQQKLNDAHTRLKEKNIQINALRDTIVSNIVCKAEDIAAKTVSFENKAHNKLDRKIDNILTSRVFGIPIMLALLGLVDHPGGQLSIFGVGQRTILD